MNWISVYDQLPPAGEDVQVKNRHGQILTAFYDPETNGFQSLLGEVTGGDLGPGKMWMSVPCVLEWRPL